MKTLFHVGEYLAAQCSELSFRPVSSDGVSVFPVNGYSNFNVDFIDGGNFRVFRRSMVSVFIQHYQLDSLFAVPSAAFINLFKSLGAF